MHDSKKIKINKAFSLVEISIVIIIISVITAGIVSGLNIASSAKLKLATNLTNNSPILSMKNLNLWYETTLADESLIFVDGIDEDGAKISGWNDISYKNLFNYYKPSTAKTLSQTNSNAYANYNAKAFANSIPGVKLNDVFGDADFLYNGTFNYRTKKLTLFLVLKREIESYASRIIVGMPNGFTYDYQSTNALMVATIDSSTYGNGYKIYSRHRADVILHPNNNQAFILTHIFDASANNGKLYINGELLMNYNSATSSEIIIDKLYLGKANYVSSPTDRSNGNGAYHGDYGEMIFFGDSLSDEDRKKVETYLGKKFDIKLNH